MIDNILDLSIFAKVASAGSLTQAASDMGLSLAVVSKRLAALEEKIGVRLLNRTTRRQSLTLEGSQFHEYCVSILAEVQRAETAMQRSRSEVAGLLKISAPRIFGCKYVAGLVAEFQDMHPNLRVELNLSDEIVDLVDAGIDVALRFGALLDSTMTARYIAPSQRILCASPGYLQRHGVPLTPHDLAQHRCILYGTRNTRHWLFQQEGQPVSVEIDSTFLCNDGNAAQALAIAGAGIFFKSLWDVGSELLDGTLMRVLESYSAPIDPLHLVYPHALHLTPRVRSFADFAIEKLRRQWQTLTA